MSAIVQNNGWLSEFFNLSRGVRQGCPLSPYLFTMCVELLAMKIRNNIYIEGLCINSAEEQKISQYADDTSLSLLYSEKSLKETLHIFNEFELISGLKMNLDKTEIMRIGAIKHSEEKLLPEVKLKWTKGPIKVLGVFVSADHKETLEINYNPKLGKIKQILHIWSQRNVSLLGKILLIKTFAISQLVYLLSVLPSPSNNYFKELEKTLFNFIWNGKPDKMKRTTAIAPLNKGGLNMINIATQNKSLKITWIQRLLDNSNANWKSLVYNQLPDVGEYLWTCNFNKKEVNYAFPKLCNSFWIDVLKAWAEYNFHSPSNRSEIIKQNIWFNSHITINNKILFYKTWFRAGITIMSDLINNQGQFLVLEELKRKYDINIDFLNYLAFKKAIPTKWLNILLINETENTHEFIPDIDKVQQLKQVKKKCSRYIYNNLIISEYVIPLDIFNKWTLELNLNLDETFWLDTCNSIYTSTIATYHKTFYIKYLNRILATNEKLYQMGIIDTNKCSFCNEDTESLSHLFWYCKIIKSFWKKIMNWMVSIFDTNIDFKVEEILFFCPLSEPIPFNFIFLLARQHIYFCRNKQICPNLFSFINYLNETKQMELSIAKRNSTLKKFYNRWGLITS